MAEATSTMRIRSLLPVVMCGFLLFGCNKPADDSTTANASGGGKKKLTVGFSQIGAESGWRSAETESIRSEATKRGVDLKFSDAQQKQENQVKAIRSFIQQKVDAIIFAPVVSSGWDPVLKEAQEAKIPVVLVDRGITADPSLYTTLIASDFVEEGKRTAEFLGKKMNGTGNVVELEGSPGADPAIERKKGFDEELAKTYPGIKILASQTGQFTRAKGKEVMEAFLKAHGKNINAVYAHNDDMALGAIQAIEEAGMKPGTEILVVCIDGTRPALEAMVAGKINCVTECNPLLGPLAFDAVEAATSGKPVEKRNIIKDEQFDQTVAAKVLPTRKY